MATLSQIGNSLSQARKQQKLFKTRLAEQAGVHRNTVQQLEAGLGNVELNTLIAVCEVLGLEISLRPKGEGQFAQEAAPSPSALSQMLEQRLGRPTN